MAAIEIKTEIDSERLTLVSFSGTEDFSQPFAYELVLAAPKGPLTRDEMINKLVAKPATISVLRGEDQPRFIHGYLSEVHLEAGVYGPGRYRARLVPWLWFLSKRSNCRVFLDKKPTEIIREVLDAAPIKGKIDDSKLKLGDYPKLDYCVQYRETDLNFVSRLMEQYGIFYAFEHSENDHKLILGDSTGAYRTAADARVNFPDSHSERDLIKPILLSWQHGVRFVSGAYCQSDYNFTKPKLSLADTVPSSLPLDPAKTYEIYDAPGEFQEIAEAKRETKIRMQELESVFEEVAGTSAVKSFSPGTIFTVGDLHPDSTECGKSYVITSVSHSGNEYVNSAASGRDYVNQFTAIPADVCFRPPRITPKPIVSGLQSAVVVGPKGQEIHLDKYGRILVQFHWDRYGTKDQKSSWWVRVSQSVAGRKWGFQAYPRIGQEVILDFEEGDPDRPIVVGSLYNADQMPYYDPETDGTKTAIRTHSFKNDNGYNELMFDDAADKERVFLHAEKDMDLRVKNDARERVIGNRHSIVGYEKDGKTGGSYRELVYKDQEVQIKGNRVDQVEGNATNFIGGGKDGGKYALDIEKSMALRIGADGMGVTNKGNYVEEIDGVRSSDVKGESIGKAASWSMETDQVAQIKAGAKFAVDAGSELHLKSGASLVLESGTSISMKVGGNFIMICSGGIFMQGTLVGINSGGAAIPGTGFIPMPVLPVTPEPLLEKRPEKPDTAHDEKPGFKSCE